MNVLSSGPKASNSSKISDAISPRFIRKNPPSVYARVPHMMAQFVLKIEKLSHIIGSAPILEIARLRSPSPIMAPVLAECKKIRPSAKLINSRKNFVPHGILLNFYVPLLNC